MGLSIAFAQLNPTVGDVAGNLARVRRARDRAAELGADLVVFSELVLVGYPPEDLVLRPALVEAAASALRELERRHAERIAGAARDAALARRRVPPQCRRPGRRRPLRAQVQARTAQLRRLRREARLQAGTAARAGRRFAASASAFRSARTSGFPR